MSSLSKDQRAADDEDERADGERKALPASPSEPRLPQRAAFGLTLNKKRPAPKATGLFGGDSSTNLLGGDSSTGLFGEDSSKGPTTSVGSRQQGGAVAPERKVYSVEGPRHGKGAVAEEALEDYDESYDIDSAHARRQRRLQASRQEDAGPAPRYMPALLEAAARRRHDHECLSIRRHRRDGASTEDGGRPAPPQEGGEDEQVFVTASYRKKLEELKAAGLDVDDGASGKGRDPLASKEGAPEMGKFYSSVFRQHGDISRSRN